MHLEDGNGYCRRVGILALVALSLISPSVFAQEARGTIQGRVSDTSGGAVPGAGRRSANTATGLDHLHDLERRRQLSRAVPDPRRLSRHRDARRLQQVRQPDVRLHVADVLTVDATLKAGASDEGHRHRHGRGRRRHVRRTRTGRRRAAHLRAADPRRHRRRTRHPRAGRRQHDRPAVAQGGVQQRPVAVLQRRRRREAQRLHDRRRRQRRGRSRRLQPAVGRGRGVQDPDRHLRRRGRQHDGRVGQPGDQERHEQPCADRSTSGSAARRSTPTILRQPRRPPETRLHGQPLRRRRRRSRARNRTFYFANVEFNPFEVPSPQIVTVPTAKMRNGDFSELLALGPQYQIYDPATIRPHPTQAGRFTRDPFPGNIIPQSRIDPVARRSSSTIPLPNQPGTADGANNYSNPTAVALETYYTATTRVDHSVCRIVIASTAATAGTTGRRRKTIASTTSPPASSSIARIACSRSTMRIRSRTTS